MPLNLTFLGTGGAFTDFRENYHNNALIGTGEGLVMIDCGYTAVQSLKELGFKPWEVMGTIITHTHGDHAGGLEQLIWERVYTGVQGPGWLRTGIYSNPNICRDVIRMISSPIEEFTDQDGVCRPDGFHRLVEIHGVLRPFDIGGVRFALHRTPHVVGPNVDKPAFGVLIQQGSDKVYFTSDTTFRPNIGELFHDAAVIFHDCTFSPAYPGTVHTHYEELKLLPPEVRGRIVLMHHTKVPEGISPRDDGFLWAANRHDTFTLDGDKLTVSGKNGGAVFQNKEGVFTRVASLRVG